MKKGAILDNEEARFGAILNNERAVFHNCLTMVVMSNLTETFEDF